MDNLSKQQRSYTMSKIRSKNTALEVKVFKELRRQKIYFKTHYSKAPGKPDIALPKKKRAVFIHGDFWHGYNFDKWRNRIPKKYWLAKIKQNISRDRVHYKTLKRLGWSILVVWEHQLEKNFDKNITKLVDFLSIKM